MDSESFISGHHNIGILRNFDSFIIACVGHVLYFVFCYLHFIPFYFAFMRDILMNKVISSFSIFSSEMSNRNKISGY